MPKSVPPGMVQIPNVGSFIANAVPDPFDARDLPYLPRLQPLPRTLDQRDLPGRYILHQAGQSCTGHALACVINTVLAHSPPVRAARSATGVKAGARDHIREQPISARVSPYMLYRLARRYDEFEGEDDVGSSLRGALKGWFHHGVALEQRWPDLDMENEPDLEDPAFVEECLERPLGAFYRVNAFRLDDMQSAISELHAIAVTAAIHNGWIAPAPYSKGDEEMFVIERPIDPKALGGHAFALVGYNEVGFLVQNSWGNQWGRNGFATLSYEDWFDCAYDAWVVRPGVPHTPFVTGRVRDKIITGNKLATGPGPNLKRLERHVVNLGIQGRLSNSGSFISTPAQIERIFERMQELHDDWIRRDPGLERHVVLYAHAGLVSASVGLETADKHLNWWLNNRVYPIYFAWQSGPSETLIDQLVGSLKDTLPVGGVGFDLVEQFDRLVEKKARSNFRWMWDEMKKNARAASTPIAQSALVEWPPRSSPARSAMASMPGASLTVSRLAHYVEHVDADNVRVHLVGHGAGSIFLAPLLERLHEAKIPVESMTLLAPAIRVDEFEQTVLPHLGPGRTVKRFATFGLTDQRELNDTCAAGDIEIYQKSLLYLVSRALEEMSEGEKGGEVRLLGMEKFFERHLHGSEGPTLQEAIKARGGACIFSRSATAADSRSDSVTHGGFDDDAPTMTSVAMRVRNVRRADQVDDYARNAALNSQSPVASGRRVERDVSIERTTEPVYGAVEGAEGAQPLNISAAVRDPGDSPVAEVSEPRLDRPTVPPSASQVLVPEVADAPRSASSIADVLESRGWIRSGKDVLEEKAHASKR